MTPDEKLALTRRSYAAFTDAESLIGLYVSDCEWHMGSVGAAMGTGVYRGHDGLRELVAQVLDGVDAASWSPEVIDARIRRDGILLVEYMDRGRTSGYTHMELTRKAWQEVDFRDGLIRSVAQFEEPPPGWDEATPIA